MGTWGLSHQGGQGLCLRLVWKFGNFQRHCQPLVCPCVTTKAFPSNLTITPFFCQLTWQIYCYWKVLYYTGRQCTTLVDGAEELLYAGLSKSSITEVPTCWQAVETFMFI